MKAKQIGDKVWIAWGTDSYKNGVPCPVCFGRRMVHIVLGDESLWGVSCKACASGGNLPTGRSSIREARVGVIEATVSKVELSRDGFKYGYTPYTHNILGVFDTEEEALACADGALPGLQENRERLNADVTAIEWVGHTWTLSYHQNKIKKALASQEYHEKQITLLREAKK